MAATKMFPKTLYVKIENEGEDAFFLADEGVSNFAVMGEKTKVAVYHLHVTGDVEGTILSNWNGS